MENPFDARLFPHAQAKGMSRVGRAGRSAIGLWFMGLLSALAIALAGLSAPAVAHDKKQHPQAQQGQQRQAAPGAAIDRERMSGAMDSMDMEMDRSGLPFLERLLGWIGRLHPAVVHFPIAFFPAALLTAIAGRRRPAFSAPVQFLVVAGGIFAPIAAATGWFAGVAAEPEPILAYHRWLGVAIGLAGAGLGAWAWRRPWEDRGAGMIVALTIMTIAIAVQGFLGAGLTHGMDHMMY